MKRMWRGMVAIGMALALLGPLEPARAQPTPGETVRGLWVLRSSLTSPGTIDELVRTAVGGGYNTLLVQVRGRGDAYYQSALDPRADDLSGQPSTFDPLRLTLDRAHAAGLTVHAWFNVNLVASATTLPRSSSHIVLRQPDWLMVPRSLAPMLARQDPRTPGYVAELARWTRTQNSTVEGLFLSPIPEGAQQYTLAVVRDLLERYDVDGLHLDYIRYPTEDFDYSAGALDAFRTDRLTVATEEDRRRHDARRGADPTVWTRAYPESWEQFRRDRLTLLVERIGTLVRQVRPTAVVSAAVVPQADDARRLKLQDWSAWSKAGLLDVICPMAYATAPADFRRQLTAARAGAAGRPVWAGIGAWRMPVARTAEHIRVASDLDVAGILLFSYDGLLTATTPRGSYFTRLKPAVLAVRGSR